MLELGSVLLTAQVGALGETAMGCHLPGRFVTNN